jgi:hypothetical protein
LLRRIVFARGLGGLEFFEGFVIGAAEGVLVAVELDKGVVFAVPKEGDAEEAGVLVVDRFPAGTGGLAGGEFAVLDQAHLFHAIGKEAGFDAHDAAETPFGPGQLAEAGLLGFVGGLVDGAEAVEEGLEFGGVLHGEEGVAGAEAVGAAVIGDFGFALGGARAGGELGVAAVGVDLELGRHGGTSGGRLWRPVPVREIARGWRRIGGLG